MSKVASRKAKGRKLQQTVCEGILKRVPSLHLDDVQSRSMGAQGEDVMLSPAARKVFPYTVECKNQEVFKGIYDKYAQAKGHKDYEPLLIIKMNRQEPLAVVSLEHFLDMSLKGKK